MRDGKVSGFEYPKPKRQCPGAQKFVTSFVRSYTVWSTATRSCMSPTQSARPRGRNFEDSMYVANTVWWSNQMCDQTMGGEFWGAWPRPQPILVEGWFYPYICMHTVRPGAIKSRFLRVDHTHHKAHWSKLLETHNPTRYDITATKFVVVTKLREAKVLRGWSLQLCLWADAEGYFSILWRMLTFIWRRVNRLAI